MVKHASVFDAIKVSNRSTSCGNITSRKWNVIRIYTTKADVTIAEETLQVRSRVLARIV